MAESTLSLTKDGLRDAVTEIMLSSTTGYDSLATAEKNAIDRIINSGLRKFYQSHDWTFLKIWTTLSINAPYSTGTIAYDHTGGSSERLVTLSDGTFPSWVQTNAGNGVYIEIDGVNYEVATYVDSTNVTLASTSNPGSDVSAGTSYEIHQDDYDLPDDFGQLIGDLTFEPSDNAWYVAKEVGPGRIKALRQREFHQNYANGDPQLFAIVQKALTETTGQRWQIWLWPDVTAAATGHYRYQVRTDSPSVDGAYVYGSAHHMETIKYACLSVMELEQDREVGAFSQQYERLLVDSRRIDGMNRNPGNLGYNRDASDDMGMFSPRRRDYLSSTGVTYKGTGS